MIKQAMLAGALLAALVSGGAVQAAEVCADHPSDQWMSKEELSAKAAAMGYDVRSVKAEDGCWEVKGFDKDGKRVEVYLDPVTAEVKKTKR
jgi:hypothetical protein